MRETEILGHLEGHLEASPCVGLSLGEEHLFLGAQSPVVLLFGLPLDVPAAFGSGPLDVEVLRLRQSRAEERHLGTGRTMRWLELDATGIVGGRLGLFRLVLS